MEVVANEIVQRYYQQGLDVVWLVDFHRHEPGGDVVRVMKTNCERITRWLDDQTKDTNLMSANFVPMLLQVMPPDLRLQVLVEAFTPLGIDVSLRMADEVTDSHAALMSALAKESGEGMAAFALLADRCTHDELTRALVEIEEGAAAHQDAAVFIRQRLGRGG
ncbi:hypothetical protein [Aquitalea magnusonii]|nr:hypothetical protein [Aquitalea magnusonii]